MEQYKELLKQFLSTKSISTDAQYLPEIEKTAVWLEKKFTENKFKVNIVRGYDNPIVVASYQANPDFKTCLIYGHYDVQPASKEEGWGSEPFDLFEDDIRLYGRGVVDNKGQVLIHIATAFDLIQKNQLGYNLVFMIEGNEETGSPSLGTFLDEHKELLKADFTLISDGEMDIKNPSLDAGFRGGFNSALTLKTSSIDLHSGLYGGVVPNAAHELNTLLSKMISSETNEILIPHFYDDVDEITPELAENNDKIPFNEDHFKSIAGVKGLAKTDMNVYSILGLMPTLQVTGIETGYNGDGYRNSVPASATAKINVRLVNHQNPDQIVELVRDFITKNVPPYVAVTFRTSDPYEGLKVNMENPYTQKALQVMTDVYGIKPVYKFSGGGIPIVTMFHNILKMENVMVPLGNEDCQMHAINENFRKEYVEKALQFSKEFLKK